MRILLIRSERLQGGIYPLTKREKNYLFNSLRLETGEILKCKDEEENYYDAELLDQETLRLSPSDDKDNFLDSMPAYQGPFCKLTLIQVICKGKKNEKIIREAQEIGCEKVIFCPSMFSEEKKLEGHALERIETIAREAVQQSGGKLLDIEVVKRLEEAFSKARGIKIILHQGVRNSSCNLFNIFSSLKGEVEVTVAVGSEGGFSEEECELAEDLGFKPVLLNTNILRAETAGIYAMSSIQTMLNRN